MNIDMGYGISIWDTVSIWSSNISIWSSWMSIWDMADDMGDDSQSDKT
jgi:hypothetical protein